MDYPTKPRSDAEVKGYAERLRKYFRITSDEIDVLECLKSPRIWTLRGEERLIFEICFDESLGEDDALTTYAPGAVKISVTAAVHDAAKAGDGRARNTLAHELGHAVMHSGAPKARRTGAKAQGRPNWMRPAESAERQANVFGPAFLISDHAAEMLPDAKSLSKHFGVSFECAEVFLAKRRQEQRHIASQERVRQKAASFCAQPTYDPILSIRFLPDPCEGCGERTLLPEGNTVRCMNMNCRRVQDFQDGDVVGGVV